MKRRNLLKSAVAFSALTVFHPSFALANAAFPYEKNRQRLLGSEMAYVDAGEGDPVVFVHGNPTSSYLWRNILPTVAKTHRVIAPDLIGMGDSGKPDIPYTYVDHAAYLHGLLDTLDLQNVTLVLHDWGGALGMDWADKNPERVRAVAFMETMLPPRLPAPSYESLGEFLGGFFQTLRTPDVGEQMVLDENFFIDEVLGKMAVNTPLTPTVMEEYNRYYPTAESRKPLLQWPREVPIGREPAHSVEAVSRASDWLFATDIPKLMFHVDSGVLIPPELAEDLKRKLSNLTAVNLGAGVHYIQEDYPEDISSVLANWLPTT